MRILELFSGIGAVSVAAGDLHEVVGAIDISQPAMEVFRANHLAPTRVQEITSLSDKELAGFSADLWWMSPPCQPFTRRGLQQDLADSRTTPLLHLIRAIESVGPTHVAVENVIGFEDSATYSLLTETLNRAGYHVAITQLCSSEFGLPNLRPRFFLAASKAACPHFDPPRKPQQALAVSAFLDSDHQLRHWGDDLFVDAATLEAYRRAVSIVTGDSQLTRCFTSAYGRSIVRSGSYLQVENGFRRFSPVEVARLLGFGEDIVLPRALTSRQLWKLLGNAVSVPCARLVLNSFD